MCEIINSMFCAALRCLFEACTDYDQGMQARPNRGRKVALIIIYNSGIPQWG